MKTIEQALLDKILYIGNEIPDGVSSDSRMKFVILGTPQELIDEVSQPEAGKYMNPQQSTVEERFDKIKDELYKHTISVEKDGYMSVSGFIKLNDLKEVFESEIQLAEQKAEKKGWDNAFKHVSNTLAVAYGTVFIKKDTLIYIPSVEEIQQKAREEEREKVLQEFIEWGRNPHKNPFHSNLTKSYEQSL